MISKEHRAEMRAKAAYWFTPQRDAALLLLDALDELSADFETQTTNCRRAEMERDVLKSVAEQGWKERDQAHADMCDYAAVAELRLDDVRRELREARAAIRKLAAATVVEEGGNE